jgi:hypothetical protein
MITEWRRSAAKGVNRQALDELETHLRETTEPLVRSNINPPEAFRRALAELGGTPEISSEFRKLDEPLWLPVKLAVGLTALLALILNQADDLALRPLHGEWKMRLGNLAVCAGSIVRNAEPARRRRGGVWVGCDPGPAQRLNPPNQTGEASYVSFR